MTCESLFVTKLLLCPVQLNVKYHCMFTLLYQFLISATTSIKKNSFRYYLSSPALPSKPEEELPQNGSVHNNKKVPWSSKVPEEKDSSSSSSSNSSSNNHVKSSKSSKNADINEDDESDYIEKNISVSRKASSNVNQFDENADNLANEQQAGKAFKSGNSSVAAAVAAAASSSLSLSSSSSNKSNNKQLNSSKDNSSVSGGGGGGSNSSSNSSSSGYSSSSSSKRGKNMYKEIQPSPSPSYVNNKDEVISR